MLIYSSGYMNPKYMNMDPYSAHGSIGYIWFHMVPMDPYDTVHMHPYGAYGSIHTVYMGYIDPYGAHGSMRCTWIHMVQMDPTIGRL